MKTIIRFRNRQIFTQYPTGNWQMSESKESFDLNQLLKEGHTVCFYSPLTTITLTAVNADEFIVRSVYAPNMDVVMYEGEKETNGLIERLIEKGMKAQIIYSK